MITINPENPSSDDVVEFTVNRACPFYEVTRNVADTQFIINASASEPISPCVSAAPPHPYTWSVGRIQAGEYQVILKYPDNYEGDSHAFSVSQGELPFPEPSIPTLGMPTAIMLVVLLGWLANKSLKRTRKRAA